MTESEKLELELLREERQSMAETAGCKPEALLEWVIEAAEKARGG